MNKEYGYSTYQLTYPFKGDTIYRSKSIQKVVKRCYKDFKDFNDINEGMFSVTDLNNNVEYQFQVKNSKLYKMGETGYDNSNPNEAFNPNLMGGADLGKIDDTSYSTEKIKNIVENELRPLNQKLDSIEKALGNMVTVQDDDKEGGENERSYAKNLMEDKLEEEDSPKEGKQEYGYSKQVVGGLSPTEVFKVAKSRYDNFKEIEINEDYERGSSCAII